MLLGNTSLDTSSLLLTRKCLKSHPLIFEVAMVYSTNNHPKMALITGLRWSLVSFSTVPKVYR